MVASPAIVAGVPEPLDECPDLANEAVVTRGGLDKLAVYRGPGVGEVWMWIDDRLRVFALRDDPYAEQDRSALVPALDLEQLATFVRRSDQHEAVSAYRDLLRG